MISIPRVEWPIELRERIICPTSKLLKISIKGRWLMSADNTPNPSTDGYINHNELKEILFYIEYNPLSYFIMIGEHSYAIRSSVALATVTMKDKNGKHVQDTIPVFKTNWINKKRRKRNCLH